MTELIDSACLSQHAPQMRVLQKGHHLPREISTQCQRRTSDSPPRPSQRYRTAAQSEGNSYGEPGNTPKCRGVSYVEESSYCATTSGSQKYPEGCAIGKCERRKQK